MVVKRDVNWRPLAEALPYGIMSFAAGVFGDRAAEVAEAIGDQERERIPALLDEMEIALGVLLREWRGEHLHPPGTLDFLVERSRSPEIAPRRAEGPMG